MRFRRVLPPLLVAALLIAGGISSAIAQEASPPASPPAGPPLPPGCSVIASGLMDPRYVAVGADGSVYVTEAGIGGDEVVTPPPAEEEPPQVGSPAAEVVEGATPVAPEGEGEGGPPLARGLSGQVTRVAPDGTQSVLATGLASYGPVFSVGPAGVVAASGQVWVAVGGTAGALGIEPLPTENSVVRIDEATGQVTVVAEIGSYEVANNPDGTDVNPNLYGLGLGTDGQIYVADAGGNTIYRVDPATGQFALVAVVPGLSALTGATPAADPMQERQPVPTGLAVGPDGAIHVALLSEGWPPDAPSVLRLEADGTFTGLASGLSAVVGLAFGPDGALYVSQLTTDFTAEVPPPGNVLRVLPDGTTEVAVDGLVIPHGIAFDQDGNLYVAHNSIAFAPGEPQGQVLRCDGVAAGTAAPGATPVAAATRFTA